LSKSFTVKYKGILPPLKKSCSLDKKKCCTSTVLVNESIQQILKENHLDREVNNLCKQHTPYGGVVGFRFNDVIPERRDGHI